MVDIKIFAQNERKQTNKQTKKKTLETLVQILSQILIYKNRSCAWKMYRAYNDSV